jgi:hypothetical protein
MPKKPARAASSHKRAGPGKPSKKTKPLKTAGTEKETGIVEPAAASETAGAVMPSKAAETAALTEAAGADVPGGAGNAGASRAPEPTRLFQHAAGIAAGPTFHSVSVPERGPGPHVLKFPANACGLAGMAEFLARRGVTHVAMEAAGICWRPPCNYLRAHGFAVTLLDPRSVRRAPVGDTDVGGCQRIRSAFSGGLAEECRVPDDDIELLRELASLRQTAVSDRSTYARRMARALRQLNVFLDGAGTSAAGKAGLDIIDAILDGERDPLKLARLRDPRCRKDAAETAACLEGVYNSGNLVELRVARDCHRFSTQRLDYIDGVIQEELLRFTSSAGADGNRVPDPGGPAGGD